MKPLDLAIIAGAGVGAWLLLRSVGASRDRWNRVSLQQTQPTIGALAASGPSSGTDTVSDPAPSGGHVPGENEPAGYTEPAASGSDLSTSATPAFSGYFVATTYTPPPTDNSDGGDLFLINNRDLQN